MKKRISLVLVLALGLVSVSLAAEDTWTTKADMPTARYVLSSSVVDGRIYAIGGSPDGSTGIRTVEAYNPLTDTWTTKADMPMVRAAGTSSVVNGKIYVMGGYADSTVQLYSSVIEYDATTDTWTRKADIPTPRFCVSSSVVNGKIYAIGGALTYNSTALSTVEEYDPATDTWTRKADMPTGRAYLSTSAVNGKIYAIGGTLLNPEWYLGISTVEEYNPATNTWTKKADMPTGRTYLSTSVVNGKIYAIGGFTTRDNDLSPVEEYDPVTDTWTRKADMSTTRSALATSAVNGKIYAIGGRVGGSRTVLSTVEEYDPNPLVVDFNGDGIVDSADMCIMVDHWGEDYPLCDIGPMPWGDGIVDVQDLIVLAEHLFEDVIDSTLAAHWPLDEAQGVIAHDSAADRDGTLMGGPVWQTDAGIVAGALQFDGIDDYVSADPVLNPADGTFSLVVWIKGGTPGQAILSQTGAANWLSTDSVEGNLMTELKASGRGAGGPLLSQTVITDGNWHRIGFVWDGSDRTLYVDGIAVAQDTQDGLANSSNGLNIGCGKNMQPGTFFSGMIDDVRIYNRAVKP
jgi:N-acetylneuraminic acid mutarotase